MRALLPLAFLGALSLSIAADDTSLKQPEYFGVFARMKDGSLVELDKRPIGTVKYSTATTVNISQMLSTPRHDVTALEPKALLDFANIDHFLIHTESKVESGALESFHKLWLMNGGLVDIRGEPSKAKMSELFLNLSDPIDAKAGLRVAKSGTNLYKVFFPDEAEKKAVHEKLTTGATSPVSLVGVMHDGAAYQFKLKKPIPTGPKLTSYTLNLDLYSESKKPGYDLGEGLYVADQKGQRFLKGYDCAQLSPANLALTGDFTVRVQMAVPWKFVLAIASDTTRRELSVSKAKRRFVCEEQTAAIPTAPTTARRGDPIMFEVEARRKGDILTFSCQGNLLATTTLPATEEVHEVSIVGFASDIVLKTFSISSP